MAARSLPATPRLTGSPGVSVLLVGISGFGSLRYVDVYVGLYLYLYLYIYISITGGVCVCVKPQAPNARTRCRVQVGFREL